MSARIPSAVPFSETLFAVLQGDKTDRVELPSGAIASVSADAPTELLSAIEAMARHVQEAAPSKRFTE